MYFITGTVVTLTATPRPDAIFVDWSGDVVTTSNWLTVTVDAPRQVTAMSALPDFLADSIPEQAINAVRCIDNLK